MLASRSIVRELCRGEQTMNRIIQRALVGAAVAVCGAWAGASAASSSFFGGSWENAPTASRMAAIASRREEICSEHEYGYRQR